ncbi:MAG: FecR domain-containing protein [Dysgonamonadaceae bacterium]|jgi:ferric-dicitrate binding protein FerR (iron transport regulator)|nr:FecR domain-containing protein [Dysgonamonadaceae bacterium]
MEIDHFTIAKIIAASMAKTLTQEDKEWLNTWLNESPANKQLYHRIARNETRLQKREKYNSFDLHSGWNNCLRKRVHSVRKHFWLQCARYAAVLLIVVGTVFYFMQHKGSPTHEEPEIVVGAPGTSKAQLVLSTGQIVDLEAVEGDIEAGTGQSVIRNSNRLLSYQEAQEKTTAELIYNEIRVPRGGEYRLELSDGTQIYLNSETRLRFPVRFTGASREVELEGEAYFHVTKDKGKPFIVHTANYEVKVLGTQFNISSYVDNSWNRTTLVEGLVAIRANKASKELLLNPNEQFAYNAATGETQVTTVDVSYSTAWKDGKFRFRDDRLDDLMQVIGRWYDVEMEYADEEVKGLRFSFNLNRYDTIDPIIRIFQQNGKINIEKEGRTLKIKQVR